MLATYEHIALVMGRMRVAAQGAHWDLLRSLESDCSALVASLRLDTVGEALTPQQEERKYDLVRQLLADDAEIRRHTEPWMEQLKTLMESAGRSRKINTAYGI
jgi:flagellar protein FliT